MYVLIIYLPVSITPTQSSAQAGVSKTSSKESHSQTKFYAASEEGDLIYADYFNEKTAEEKGRSNFVSCKSF
jgi:hypothetical protein